MNKNIRYWAAAMPWLLELASSLPASAQTDFLPGYVVAGADTLRG